MFRNILCHTLIVSKKCFNLKTHINRPPLRDGPFKMSTLVFMSTCIMKTTKHITIYRFIHNRHLIAGWSAMVHGFNSSTQKAESQKLSQKKKKKKIKTTKKKERKTFQHYYLFVLHFL